MSRQEGATDYKYEDYASEMALHRLPQTAVLVNKKMKITLDSGASFDLEFIDRNKVTWQSDNKRGTDWCEVLDVAPQTYFIDMTFANQPRQSQTFIVTPKHGKCSRSALLCAKAMSAKEPRAVQEFFPVCWATQQNLPRAQTGTHARSDGLAGDLYYNDNQVFEHCILNYIGTALALCSRAPQRSGRCRNVHICISGMITSMYLAGANSAYLSAPCFSITGIK